MRRNGLRLLKLVNTLLDFSRLEAGRLQVLYEPIDVAAYTADLASTFQSAMDKAGVRYVVDCRPMADPTFVDRDSGRRSSSTLSRTRSSTPSKVRSRFRWANLPTRAVSSCACETRDWEFPATSCRGYSSDFTASKARTAGRTRAPVLGSRWFRGWLIYMAER